MLLLVLVEWYTVHALDLRQGESGLCSASLCGHFLFFRLLGLTVIVNPVPVGNTEVVI